MMLNRRKDTYSAHFREGRLFTIWRTAGFILLLGSLVLSGCRAAEGNNTGTSEEPEEGARNADVSAGEAGKLVLDTSYNGLYVRWEQAENADHSEVIVQRVPGTDTSDIPENGANISDKAGSGTDADELVDLEAVIVSEGFCDARAIVGYSAQEHDYFGSARIAVKDLDAETQEVLQELYSDPFLISDYYPEAETIDPAGRELVLFSWSRGGPSSYIEDLQDTVSSFTVYGEPEAGYLMNAVYYDKKGAEKELERALTQEEQRRFAELLEGGLLRRKYIRDPNFVLLDGGYPETFYADYEGSTFLEQNYYEFVPAEGRADMLKDWFAQLCAN